MNTPNDPRNPERRSQEQGEAPYRGAQTGPPVDDDEITLAELYQKFRSWIRLLFRHKKIIGRTMAATLVIGVFVALGSRQEYTAENAIISYSTEQQDDRSDLRGLAGMAGIDIGRGSSGFVTEAMFPRLLQTYPLASKLAEEPLRFQNPDTLMSAYYYFDELQDDDLVERVKPWTIGLPKTVISLGKRAAAVPVRWIRGSEEEEFAGALEAEENGNPTSADQEVIRLEPSDAAGEVTKMVSKPLLIMDSRHKSIVNEVAGRITTERENRVITVTATMPDPYAAADLANTATEVLMQELTNFEIRKTRDQLEFLESRYEDVRERFEEAQRNLLEFQDRNTGTVTSITQIEAQRLQSEYNRASSRYNNLTERIDQTRYQLNEDTPLFTELDPVQVPQRPSEPNRERIILLWLFLGAFGSVGFITGRHLLRKLDKESRK